MEATHTNIPALMLKTSQFRCPLWKGVGISTPGRHRDLHQLLRFIRVSHSAWWMARDSAEHWHSNRSNETDSVWGIAGCQAAYPKDLGVRVWKLRPIVIHLHLVLGSRLPFCWHISISLSSFLILNIYIYATPPLKSLPFLWVSSVQTAERFLRWNTNSVKTIVFVRIIRFILFTLLVLKRSTLFRKSSQYWGFSCLIELFLLKWNYSFWTKTKPISCLIRLFRQSDSSFSILLFLLKRFFLNTSAFDAALHSWPNSF